MDTHGCARNSVPSMSVRIGKNWNPEPENINWVSGRATILYPHGNLKERVISDGFGIHIIIDRIKATEYPMNRFQAMARIMAILCEGDRIKKGSPRYRIARKLIASKIDRMGPDAAYFKAKWNKHELLMQIEELQTAERAGKFLRDFI